MSSKRTLSIGSKKALDEIFHEKFGTAAWQRRVRADNLDQSVGKGKGLGRELEV